MEDIENRDLLMRQKSICKKYDLHYQPVNLDLKVGITQNIKEGAKPIHGLRIKEEHGTSGWYFWSGEWSNKEDFFEPIHGTHIKDYSNLILPYLGLPEGSRFIIDESYEDIWFDKSIIEGN